MTIQADLVASGLAAPTFAASPPGDPNRLFVTEKNTGRVVILDLATSQVAAQPFFDVAAADLSFEDERGLLGLAFHPNYAANGRLYLNLTNELGDTEIWEVTDAASTRVLLTIDRTAGVTNHNGGWIGFGPDGFLYIGSGDSGVGNDPENAAQNTNDLRGKMLRIDVDSDAFPADPARNYAIPAENPFGNEVFAYGLRNPWRASSIAQRAISTLPTSGRTRARRSTTCPRARARDLPVVDYGHGVGDFQGFAVTGGYVYRGPGGAQGQYFFADFASGHVWTLSIEGRAGVRLQQRDDEIAVNGGTFNQIASYAVDGNGRLYGIGLDGEIHRLTPFDEPARAPAEEPRSERDSSDDVEDVLVAGAVVGLVLFAFDDFF